MIRVRPQTAAYCMLALVMLLWAGNSIVGRAVREDIPPLFLALLRWTGALLVIIPFAARHVAEDRAAIARNWPMILLLGLLGVAAYLTRRGRLLGLGQHEDATVLGRKALGHHDRLDLGPVLVGETLQCGVDGAA
jgi:hypothetical protein